MVEKMIICLVQLTEVLVIRKRLVWVMLSHTARPSTEQIRRGLEIDHQVGCDDVGGEEIIESLVDEQLVVIKVEIRIDLVFVEKVVRNGQLAE